MNLIPTRRGIEVAATLLSNGMKLAIESFKIGSSFGYVPNPDTDTDIRGTQLYSGTPSNYRVADRNKLEYTCYMNELVGDFNWGEVGAYIRDENDELVLFALGCMPQLQPKTKTTSDIRGNVVAEILSINLNSIEAVISYEVQQLSEAKMLAVQGVYLLAPPQASPSNAYITAETDDFGNNIQAYRKTATEWSFPTHGIRKIANGVASSLGSLSLSSSQITEEENIPPGKYIIQFLSGNFEGEARIVRSMGNGILEWNESFAGTGNTGDRFILMQSTLSYYRDLFATIEGMFDDYYTKPEIDSFFYTTNQNLANAVDHLENAKAPKESPQFTGIPVVPMPDPWDNSNQIPSTSWVQNIVNAVTDEAIANIPIATRSVPGLVVAGKGIGIDHWGIIRAHGLIHPSDDAPENDQNANVLTVNNFNPNGTPIVSGVYTLPLSQSWPNGYFPTNRPGQLIVTNFRGIATYVYYPRPYSDNDYEGMRTYRKTWDSSAGWGPWIADGQSNGGNWFSLGANTPAHADGLMIINSSSWGNGGYHFYVNGLHVATNNTSVDETGSYTSTFPIGRGESWTYSLVKHDRRGYFTSTRLYVYR